MHIDESDFKKLYLEASGAVAFISVKDNKTEDVGIGTAFHVGDGIFVTAKHVLEGKTIDQISTTKRVIKKLQQGEIQEISSTESNPQKLKLLDGPHFSADQKLDIALLRVDLSDKKLPALKLDDMTSYHIDDNTYLLDEVLIIGYPPIPFTITPIQITSKARVNAVIDVRHSHFPHLIVSAIARGGFSGGPVVNNSGKVIGIVTESLVNNGGNAESGFMSVLCIEPVIQELINFYNFDLEKHDISWNSWWEPLYAAKFSNPKSLNNELNPRISDAEIYIYDDDRDLFGQIICDDPQVLKRALDAFEEICKIASIDKESNSSIQIFTPDNVSAFLIKEAAIKAKNVFIESQYNLIASVERVVKERHDSDALTKNDNSWTKIEVPF